ncbi:9c07c6c4-c1d3-4f79-9d3a-65b4d78d9d4b [Sclerotinia trifoliorum]|uniref:9c07c6c4-c1d3-4f79-9d3a-65b4d78d9d4b n=1 Tax=Sclerotinia trifoliorum TaxID=28548 RepID=A0A8H2VXS3_9HELO|nr:9c07c6c4-c1d3-4f79-9d3a-65b4d78d9d4b [Sclerotinia trifoliorum]
MTMNGSATTTEAAVAIRAHHPTHDVLEIPMGLTQQDIIQITLTGPGLILTILGIIISINLFQPSLTCTLIALAPIPWIIYNDYHNFISLGPGGTPSTLLGYVKITYLRIFALSDPYSPPNASDDTHPTIGYIQRARPHLPIRSGPRPKVAGIAPQRQISQYGSRAMYQLLRTSLNNLAHRHSDKLKTDVSCFEKKGLALFALDPINATCKGEICHVHHSDNSFHMNLHPHDAKVILEKGWGERHPMAGASTPKAISNFLSYLPKSLSAWLSPRVVPDQFVLIYAPRNREELQVVCHIIEAATFWVSGEQVTLPIESVPLGEEPVGA